MIVPIDGSGPGYQADHHWSRNSCRRSGVAAGRGVTAWCSKHFWNVGLCGEAEQDDPAGWRCMRSLPPVSGSADGGEDGGSEGLKAGIAIWLRWTGRLLSVSGVYPGHQLTRGSRGAVLRVRVRQWVHGNANMPAASAARPGIRLAGSGRAQPRRCGCGCGCQDWAARQDLQWHPARFRRRRRRGLAGKASPGGTQTRPALLAGGLPATASGRVRYLAGTGGPGAG